MKFFTICSSRRMNGRAGYRLAVDQKCGASTIVRGMIIPTVTGQHIAHDPARNPQCQKFKMFIDKNLTQKWLFGAKTPVSAIQCHFVPTCQSPLPLRGEFSRDGLEDFHGGFDAEGFEFGHELRTQAAAVEGAKDFSVGGDAVFAEFEKFL